jgi:uncharacterized repeat protein (TIGR01451 family)
VPAGATIRHLHDCLSDRLLDGNQILTASDSQFASGAVGFYAVNQNAAFFDNVLVTKLGAAGCEVDLGDYITYTLLISNQQRLPGYNLVITDVLPYSSEFVTYTASSDGASVVTYAPAPGATGTLTWTVDRLNPRSPFNALNNTALLITVTARVQGDVSAGVRLTNQALLGYDSQPGGGAFSIERAYSGGSHSAAVRTPDAGVLKVTSPQTVTIGQSLQYTITFPAVGGLPATLYNARLTDTLPTGFRMVGLPTVLVNPATIPSADITVTASTSATVLVQFTRVPSYTEVAVVITAVVQNEFINQDGVSYTNTATLGWQDLGGNPVAPVTSNVVTNTIVEPLLIIEKSAVPQNTAPNETIFFEVKVYHAATSTVPAYNVTITDSLPSQFLYINGTWPASNTPPGVAATGVYSDFDQSQLTAIFPVIDTSIISSTPLIIRFQAVVKPEIVFGNILTNVVTATWTSLLTDTFGQVRTGSGAGPNDYRQTANARVSLSYLDLVKTAPLTATAGSQITYTLRVAHAGILTATGAVLKDFMPFQMTTITGTFSTQLLNGSCTISGTLTGDEVTCLLGTLPANSYSFITITGHIADDTPEGADLTNLATVSAIDSDGRIFTDDASAETEIYTSVDLELKKSGPTTVTAGERITYTLVLTNNGPSTGRGVDVKDILPPGVTYVSGSATQGACTSSICQLGTMAPDSVVTMTIVALVGADVTGVLTNTGAAFSADIESNQANNTSTITTTAIAQTSIRVAKTDFADPVYAGNDFIYQLLVTNTGPSTARNVVLTDTIPAPLVFEGGSPGCVNRSAIRSSALRAMCRRAAGSAR